MLKTMIAAAAALCWAGVAAAQPAEPPKPQQARMAACNKDAGERKGDERKAFMKSCLSAKSDGRVAQQQKMKQCNADAKGKTGDARKQFMSACLKA